MYSGMLKVCCVAAAVLFTLAAAMPEPRPPYIDCINSNECGKNECCSIGLGRFSIPSCRRKREVGESCTTSSIPTSVNVTYPDNAHVMLRNIYYNVCPCNDGLLCKAGICTDPSQHELFNDLEYYF